MELGSTFEGQDAKGNLPGNDMASGSETCVRLETPRIPWLGQFPDEHMIGLQAFTNQIEDDLEYWANMNVDPSENSHLYCSTLQLDIQETNQNALARLPIIATTIDDAYFWGKYGVLFHLLDQSMMAYGMVVWAKPDFVSLSV